MPDALRSIFDPEARATTIDALKQRRFRMSRDRENEYSTIRQDEYGAPAGTAFFSGATNADLLRTNELIDSFAPDPGDVERDEATANALHEAQLYQRPEIAAMREDQESNALRRLLEPVRLKGYYDSQGDALNFERQWARDRANNADIAARQSAGQQATAARSRMTQASIAGRQADNDRLMRARQIEADARGVSSLRELFTGRRSDLMAEAEALRSGVNGPQDELSALASYIKTTLPGASFEDVMEHFNPQDEEELQSLQEAYGMLYGGQ